jgi:hypothetical protein
MTLTRIVRTPTLVLAAGVLLATVSLDAQPPRPGGSGRPRGPLGPQVVAPEDRTGFTPIFDGTLKGWEGDTAFWRADGGMLVGETTAANPLKANTFIVWKGGEPADFELKLEFRVSATNTGVQYRSVLAPEVGPHVLKGYQADIDFDNMWTGQLYEERGRGFLALKGQASRFPDGAEKPVLLGQIRTADEIKAGVKVNDWNTLHIVARGNTLVHVLNGQVTTVFVDDDVKRRAMKGAIGFQLHTGPPMKVEYRNIGLKTL